MDYVEILGYVAMILVACSFLLKDVIKLRVVNSLGCACFVVYRYYLRCYTDTVACRCRIKMCL